MDDNVKESHRLILERRKKLDQQEREKGLKYLHSELMKVDPISATRVHENHKQRIKRALEIFLITGKSIDQLKERKPKDTFDKRKSFSFAIIPEDRKKFKHDLRVRFENMIDAGLIKETEMLINKYSKDIPILKAVGYKQVVEFLENNLPSSHPQIFPKIDFFNDLSAIDLILNCGNDWREEVKF